MSYSRPSRRSTRTALQQGLRQLVEAELVYQSGVPPQATLSLQACAGTGHGLSVVTQEHAASSCISRLPRYWRSSFQRRKRPNLSWSRITTPRQASSSKPFPTGSRQGRERASARPMWKRLAHLTKGLELLKTPAGHP